MKMSRKEYAELFGPTTGDKIRLGDTDLWIEVEKDFTVYGEEMIFGGGKTIRDGMGQNGRITAKDGALDLVTQTSCFWITQALSSGCRCERRPDCWCRKKRKPRYHEWSRSEYGHRRGYRGDFR